MKRTGKDKGNGSQKDRAKKSGHPGIESLPAKDIIDSMHEEIVIADAGSKKVMMANKKALKKTRQKGSTKDGDIKCHNVLFSSNVPCSRCGLREAIEKKRIVRFEAETGRGENKRHYSVKTLLIRGKDEGSKRFVCIKRDISQRKKAEANLLDNEKRYRALIDDLQPGIIIASGLRPKILFANKAASQITGFDNMELCSLSPEDIWKKIYSDEERKRFRDRYRQRILGKDAEQRYETRIISKDNKTRWLEMFVMRTKFQGIPSILISFIDITSRKNAEYARKESEDRHKHLIENAPMGVALADSNGMIIDSNTTFHSMVGLNREDMPCIMNTAKNDNAGLNAMAQNFQRCLKARKAITYEHSLISKQGERLFFSMNFIPFTEPQKSVQWVQVLIEDITKSRAIEESLKRTNLELLTLLTTSTSLQLTMEIDEIIEIAIDTFRTIGYDRVRTYIMKEDGRLYGRRSSHLKEDRFREIVLEITEEYPKAYEAVKNKRPVIVKEIRSRYTDALGKDDVEESASLPLLSKNKIIGLISVDNKFSKKTISEDDLNLLMTFANQIAIAIENSMLNSENQKKIRTLSALYDISSDISGTIDLERILNLVVIKIVKLLKVDACSILLLDETGKMLIPKSSYDMGGNYLRYCPIISVDGSLSGIAIKSNSPLYISDMKSEKRTEHGDYVKSEEIRSFESIPMSLENVPIGVINIYTKKIREYSKEETELLVSLASQAAIIIENSKLYERIKDDKENLTKLLEISQAINSTLNQEELLKIILDRTIEFTNADFGFLMLVEKDFLKVKLSKGFSTDMLEKAKSKIGEGLAGWVARYGKPLVIHDVDKEPRYIKLADEVNSGATVPLLNKGNVIGVLSLESRRRGNFKKFSKSLEILTNQIAIAIENVKLYDEISSFNERLKQEIELATKELKEKNIELRKMDMLKSDFVSNVSHELRTPLTSISGYAKLLSLEKLGSLNSRQKQSLDIILEEGDRLTRLINDVLDLSKLEAGKVDFRMEPLNIEDIAKNTITTMWQTAKDKGITIEFSIQGKLPKVIASRDMIKQVYLNLLSNAIKFSPDNGKVVVSLRKESNCIESSVSDTGPGISKENQAKIFDKFYQVDSSMTRKHGGTGLGLVIVQHIVNVHEGDIRVDSEVGKGSTFIFTVPINRAGKGKRAGKEDNKKEQHEIRDDSTA